MDQELRGLAPWVSDPALRPADFVPFDPDAVDGSIPARFDQVARTHGDRPALIDGSASRTYGELGAVVHRAARALADSGIAGRPVALLFDHGAAVVEAVLAVLHASGLVLVLDVQAPAEVNAVVLADAGPVQLVHDQANAGSAGELAGGVPVVTWDHLTGGDGDPGPLPYLPGPDDGAFLAYTSGTTAGAKAALLPHRSLLHLLRGATDTLAISPSDRLPMLFPVSLAVAAYPMLLPLVNGAALCTFDMRSEGLAPFPAWLDDQAITVIYFSPTVARFMAGDGDRSFAHLRLVVLGGERVDDDAVAVVRSVFGSDVVVANGYGTTETGVLTFFFTEPGTTYGAAGVPVGRPIEGMDLYLLDVDPTGAGELYVRSRYLFGGYRGQPSATARVLSEDPETGLGVYRTGDLARFGADGCLELVGRSDSEIKVRGHRVVPGEVEQALLALPEVRDAVVEGRPDADGTNSLVAWVVVDPSAAGPEAAQVVRRALVGSVKAHLVPADVVVLDELPQLPNGKLDRRALPDPGRQRWLPYADLVAPRNELEEELVSIWEEVLGTQPIGIRDDFFDLGGQSLDAARALSILEERHGRPFPMADMLAGRTIEQLADVVRRRDAVSGRHTTVVQVQPGAAGRPSLFFVHDLYGTAWTARYLARELGPDQPLYGFESPVLRGPASPFRTLEMLALRYVTDLRMVQPEGPYHLAGYSFGGVLAFEMARQLTSDGDEVRFLGVIDVGPGYRGRHYDPRKVLDKPYNGIPSPPDPELPLRERLGMYREMVRTDRSGTVYHVLMRTGLDRWTDPLQFQLDLHRTGRIDSGRRLWYGWRQHWKLARGYRWEDRSYPGKVTLFWAEESASADATMGWGDIAEGGVDVVRIAVPHETMLQEPGVAVLAELLARELEAAASAQ